MSVRGTLRWWIGCVAAALLAAGCAPPAADAGEDGRLRVVTTTGMLADVARRVGGERVRVQELMGPGVDPHLYRATEGDVRRIYRAQLILYNGLHLESRMGEVLEHMAGRVPTVAAAERIPDSLLVRSADFPGSYDPHVWFDVSLWMRVVEATRDALVEIDPSHAGAYRSNASAYLEELAALDRYARERMARLPPERRVLVTAHDAFHYFGRAYGLEVRGLQGISTASEAGTADVQRLAEFIAARRLPALFVETSIPQRTVEAVQAAVRARGAEVRIGGELYSDALGSPGTPQATYTGMVRHNVDTIAAALSP